MAKQIQIRQGSMTRKVEVEDNATVDDIKAKYGARMDLTKDHRAHITSSAGGHPVAADGSSVVEDGAILEFSRTTGQKG
jgi:ribosomal protein S19E (S16A)